MFPGEGYHYWGSNGQNIDNVTLPAGSQNCATRYTYLIFTSVGTNSNITINAGVQTIAYQRA